MQVACCACASWRAPSPQSRCRVRQIDAMCQNETCKTHGNDLLDKWLQYDTDRALAIGVEKMGFGNASGMDDPGLAMLRALYFCNHARASKKLCKLVAVNDQEAH